VTGFAPPRIDLCWPESPATLARELRRRARGQIEVKALQGAVELRSREEHRFRVRVLPHPATPFREGRSPSAC
jgi:hypothetical protein